MKFSIFFDPEHKNILHASQEINASIKLISDPLGKLFNRFWDRKKTSALCERCLHFNFPTTELATFLNSTSQLANEVSFTANYLFRAHFSSFSSFQNTNDSSGLRSSISRESLGR